jgi:hypothetical protein
MKFVIERKTIQPGRTFSEEAVEATMEGIAAFIHSKIMERWDATGEPPSVLTIDIQAVAQ